MYNQILAVFFVLSLMVLLLWFLRRRGMATVNMAVSRATRRPRFLQVIERTSLTPQHSLHLVRVNGKTLLIGVSPQGCTQLQTFSEDFAISGELQ